MTVLAGYLQTFVDARWEHALGQPISARLLRGVPLGSRESGRYG
jgi:hypothetical protein